MWAFSRLPADNSPATFIHQSFQREIWNEIRLGERLVTFAALPLAPLLTAVLATIFTTLNGRAVKKWTRKGTIRQMHEQFSVARRYAILPPWYYIFELHNDDKLRQAPQYINRFEMKSGLYRILRDSNGGLPIPAERSTRCIKDKLCFMDRCRKFGIPTAPILLSVAKGTIKALDWNAPGLPEVDLFVKPLHGQNGKNAARWDYGSSGQYRRHDGKRATADELLEDLRHASQQRAYLVQPRLMNHSEIADIGNGTLATIRVMSCRNEQGEFEVTNAVFRMAQNSRVVIDNFHKGGLAANVDIHTGELGRATCGAWGATSDGWYEKHPETRVQILHRKLPLWPELINLVKHAHENAFPDQVLVGWDVALLDSGPCMIAINKGPDVDMIQRIAAAPLGNSRLGKLLAFNLQRAIEAKSRSL